MFMTAAERVSPPSPARPEQGRSPFVRLRELLGDSEPGKPAISLAVGEPQHSVPSFVGPVLAAHIDEFGRYPMNKGLDGFCQAAAGWLRRRFALPRAIDPTQEILVLNGSREGLFLAALAAARWVSGRRGRPAMLIPNPFYAAYAAGAVAANCEPVYLPATAETGFLPDLDALSDELLGRTVAFFIASPANPQGAVADLDYLKRVVALARRFGFLVFSDECYSEIYTRHPPAGILEAAGPDFANVVEFQSLSKRSNLPGLRIGFAAGDRRFLARFLELRNISAPQVPMPAQRVAIAAYGDEVHVEENRRLYAQKYDLADTIIGKRYGYRRPEGGFFLWLDVSGLGGDEAVALRLWREAGLRVVPGRYLARALATWSVQDPSLNHSTNSPVRNLLGVPGAIVADLLMQLLGVAALAFILPVAIWGWRLLTHRPLKRERIRLLFWIFGVLLSAGCAAALPRSAAWPLPVGLGGVIGDWMLRLAALFSGGAVTGATRISVAIAAGAGMLVCFAFATGFGWRSDKGDPDARAEDHQTPVSILLGWVAHGFLSLKARIARTLTRRPTARVPARREAPPEGRIEPRLEPSVRDIAPRVDPEADEEQHDAALQPSRRPRTAPRAPRRPSSGYVLPSLELLAAPKAIGRAMLSADTLQANATALEGVLADFGVRGEIINARPGPVVTLYELEPAPGIKSSRVIGLADDIARSMSALSARVAVVAGRNVIGIELPNPTREKVYLRELLSSRDYIDSTVKLAMCLGKTIGGEPVIVDLARMPHLLIAGTTGSGKSVALTTMILSLTYRLQPDQSRLVTVDRRLPE